MNAPCQCHYIEIRYMPPFTIWHRHIYHATRIRSGHGGRLHLAICMLPVCAHTQNGYGHHLAVPRDAQFKNNVMLSWPCYDAEHVTFVRLGCSTGPAHRHIAHRASVSVGRSHSTTLS